MALLNKKRIKKKQENVKQPSSWDQIKNMLTCKQINSSTVHDPSKRAQNNNNHNSKLGSSCRSICSIKDVVHGSTRVVHRPDNSPENTTVGQETGPVQRRKPARSNDTSSSSSRGMQFRKLSGCYECHMIVDPTRHPYSPRGTLCCCSQCGEVFPKIESLELHQTIRHAVTELGQEDSGRNIVEIIFKSSWLNKDGPIFEIERILKVHNTTRTIQRFEECRDAVRSRAAASGRKNPRCAADGNELLRFHCTNLDCRLGAGGSSALCTAVPGCGACTALRRGLHAPPGRRVSTATTSGGAHHALVCGTRGARRAMLVCRVIAGRVGHVVGGHVAAEEEATSSFDSMAYDHSVEELVVYNPNAILSCFVVIYKTLHS